MSWEVNVVRGSMDFDYGSSDFSNLNQGNLRTNWSSKEHCKKSSAWGFLGLQPWPPPSSSRTSWSSKGDEMSGGQIRTIGAASPSWLQLGNIPDLVNPYSNRTIRYGFLGK